MSQEAWILHTDSNGCLTGQCFLGLSEVKAPNSIVNIYPNPFSKELSIELEALNPESKTIFTITTVIGQVVYHSGEENLSNNYVKVLDLSYLPNGLYLVDVNVDGERIAKKVIKE